LEEYFGHEDFVWNFGIAEKSVEAQNMYSRPGQADWGGVSSHARCYSEADTWPLFMPLAAPITSDAASKCWRPNTPSFTYSELCSDLTNRSA
jgi:hypothetical protein